MNLTSRKIVFLDSAEMFHDLLQLYMRSTDELYLATPICEGQHSLPQEIGKVAFWPTTALFLKGFGAPFRSVPSVGTHEVCIAGGIIWERERKHKSRTGIVNCRNCQLPPSQAASPSSGGKIVNAPENRENKGGSS